MTPELESGIVTLGVVFIRRNLDRPLQEGPRLAAQRKTPARPERAHVKECGDETRSLHRSLTPATVDEPRSPLRSTPHRVLISMPESTEGSDRRPQNICMSAAVLRAHGAIARLWKNFAFVRPCWLPTDARRESPYRAHLARARKRLRRKKGRATGDATPIFA
jgi:hypothetical protein